MPALGLLFSVFFHQNRLGKRSFDIDFAPNIDDIKWSAMDQSTGQKFKMFIGEVVWILSLTLLINTDRLSNFIEQILYNKPGDNALTNFLNSRSALRNGWNLILAECWAKILTFIWMQGYWTDSMRTLAFLRRKYFLLLVSLYIVPISNIDSVLTWVYDYLQAGELEFQWNCIFSADNGAYFINSMLLMALFGCAFTLLRWQSLVYQIYIFFSSSSWSEITARCTNAAREDFDFDGNAADFLVNFTITCCLASTSPLVILFGFFYSCIKHMVDSYCLIGGVYKATNICTKQFYLYLTNIMLFGAVLGQVNTICCLYLCHEPEVRYLGSAARISPTFVMIALVLFIHQCQTNQQWPFRVIKEDPIIEELKDDQEPEPLYEPEVKQYLSYSESVRI